MKLLEALEILQQPAASDSPPYRAFLGCGFTPLDLGTFLSAHLRQHLPGRSVALETGLFGDLAGSLERLRATELEHVFVALEWPDLDPRLGWRSCGDWNPDTLPDIVRSAGARLDRLAQILHAIPVPVTLSLPTLGYPPVFPESPDIAGEHYWELSASVTAFAQRLASKATIISPEALAASSPPAQRFDIRSELSAGFPYHRSHADRLAELLCAAALPDPPKKGLITDLDDTLWKGLLGEDGPEGISWDLDRGSHVHALYQKTLSSLAASGVLVAIASRNDRETVERAFQRDDLLSRPEIFHPVEVHWSAKSESVARILKAWNIAADAVVFVDDSAIELAEVARAHPGIETLRFEKDNPLAVTALLSTLRRRFGRRSVSAEDRLRAQSLKSRPLQESGTEGEDFLADAEALITFDAGNPPGDDRAFDLVNKTNQFNLNGVRYAPAEWAALLRAPGAFLLVVSYQDRYGPLGRIAVLAGRQDRGELHVDVWVMSCRAFSRRIEYKCLEHLYQAFGVDTIVFEYKKTDRNTPLREFFSSLTGEAPAAPLRLTRETFTAACPVLHHRAEILSHV